MTIPFAERPVSAAAAAVGCITLLGASFGGRRLRSSLSLDNLVYSEQERRRDREAKSCGRLAVDNEFDRRRLLDGEIGGLCPLENPIRIVCGSPRDVGHVCPVGQQSPFVDVLALRVDRRQPIRRGELNDPSAILERGDVSMENERIDGVTLQCRDSRVEIG